MDNEYEFPKLSDNNKNIYRIMIITESGCDFNESEFTLEIVEIVQGTVGENDHRLAYECVREDLEATDFPQDGGYDLTIEESGEWEDVHWHKYYKVADGSRPVHHDTLQENAQCSET